MSVRCRRDCPRFPLATGSNEGLNLAVGIEIIPENFAHRLAAHDACLMGCRSKAFTAVICKEDKLVFRIIRNWFFRPAAGSAKLAHTNSTDEE